MSLDLPRLRRIAMLTLFVLLYATHVGLVAGVLQGNLGEWPWVYLAIGGAGGTALMGLWAALSPRPLGLRLLNPLPALMGTVAVMVGATSSQPPHFLEGFARAIFVGFYLGSFAAAWLFGSLMRRVRGWRIVPSGALNQSPPDSKVPFQLGRIFAETLLVALVLVWIPMARADDWGGLWDLELLLITGLMALCLWPLLAPLVPILWLVLAAGRITARMRLRAASLAILLLLSGVGVIGVLADRWEQFVVLSVTAGLAYLGTVTAILLMWFGGYRLIAVPGTNPAPPGTTASRPGV